MGWVRQEEPWKEKGKGIAAGDWETDRDAFYSPTDNSETSWSLCHNVQNFSWAPKYPSTTLHHDPSTLPSSSYPEPVQGLEGTCSISLLHVSVLSHLHTLSSSPEVPFVSSLPWNTYLPFKIQLTCYYLWEVIREPQFYLYTPLNPHSTSAHSWLWFTSLFL
jgi:hypothetical protein